MPEPSPLALAVKLFIESGAQVRSWTTRFIAANGALLSVLGALVAWGDPTEDGLELFNNILLAICLLAALCSAVLGAAVLRQLSWQRRLRDRVRALQDERHALLPEESRLPGGAIAAVLTWTMTLLMSVAWIALMVFISHAGSIVETSTRA